MSRLIYAVIASVDGYVADENGSFDWAAPSEEVHGFANDLERPIGTHLYGRRLYEVMAVWQDLPRIEHEGAVMQDYARMWQSLDKVVYSTTLTEVFTPRTTLEPTFDPLRVRAMVDALEKDASIGGPTLAAHALRAGIVDDVHVITVPVAVGGGTPCWPTGIKLEFDLIDQNRFADGTVHQHYRARR